MATSEYMRAGEQAAEQGFEEKGHQCTAPQVGSDHLGIRLYLRRRAVADLAPVVKHHHVVGQSHHHAHVVFDQHHGGAEVAVHVSDEARHVLFLFCVHPGHGFVEQQQAWSGDQCTAQLHTFLQAVGQVAHQHIAVCLQLKELKNALAPLAKGRGLAARAWQAEGLLDKAAAHVPRQAGEKVVEHAHFFEQRVVLEGAANASARGAQGVDAVEMLLFEDDLAGVKAIHAIEHIEQRTFTGAVRADQRANLAALHVKRQGIDGLDPFE